MKFIEKSGSSIEEIVLQFQKEYGLRKWEIDYEVLTKASKGFLGLIGKRDATLKFRLPELKDRLLSFTEQLLEKMQLSYSKLEIKQEQKAFYIKVVGCTDAGFLIGKNGKMLETLQYLVNRVFESCREIDKIYIDSDDYRQRREDKFLNTHIPLINKVKSSGKALTLDSMNPTERRIIHQFVAKDKGLKTLTVGEGTEKKIVIFSAKQNESEASQPKPKPAKAPNGGITGKPKKPFYPRKEKPKKESANNEASEQ